MSDLYHGCWSQVPLPHPLEPRILDVACGYDDRLVHPRCLGCHRARAESPRQQLDALEALGDAAQAQQEPSP